MLLHHNWVWSSSLSLFRTMCSKRCVNQLWCNSIAIYIIFSIRIGLDTFKLKNHQHPRIEAREQAAFINWNYHNAANTRFIQVAKAFLFISQNLRDILTSSCFISIKLGYALYKDNWRNELQLDFFTDEGSMTW